MARTVSDDEQEAEDEVRQAQPLGMAQPDVLVRDEGGDELLDAQPGGGGRGHPPRRRFTPSSRVPRRRAQSRTAPRHTRVCHPPAQSGGAGEALTEPGLRSDADALE